MSSTKPRYCEECAAEIHCLNRPVVAGHPGDPNRDRTLTLAQHLKGTGRVKCTTCIMLAWLGHSALALALRRRHA